MNHPTTGNTSVRQAEELLIKNTFYKRKISFEELGIRRIL